MPIPRRYTTDAIVLSRFDLGEADRVLTLITPGIGKLKALAVGTAKRSGFGGSCASGEETPVCRVTGASRTAAGPSTS